jgi:nucleotide-binding universal stress UspA family protein
VLGGRLAVPVNVVTVYEPRTAYLPPPQLLALPADFDVAAMDALRERAVQQERKVVGADWPVEVYTGEPASTVRRIASERNPSVVVTGVSRHGLLDRIFGEETAAHIANLAEVPVLAVTPSFTRLPRTVLIAIDLDSPPIDSTPLVRGMLADASTVYFVNAKPRATTIDGYDLTSWERMYDEGIAEVYERVMSSLDLPGKVSHQLVRLNGSTAKELLNFAQYANVELIILGQRRASLLHRRFSRGLATRILRATTCAVLVTPRPHPGVRIPAPGAGAPASSSRTETIVEPSQWATRLAELSRRNAGRTSVVEVDDSELGAQAQASGYPFMGADYDHRDDRIEIMLGARGPGRAHLTHSVVNPTSIDVLERHDGELMALRIASARGQVLVSFVT